MAGESSFAVTSRGSGVVLRRSGFYPQIGKRLLDLVLACAGLILSAPILLICAVAIHLDSRRPILFKQSRVGRCGKLFRLYKLRTMVENAGTHGPWITAANDARVTRVGSILRRFKLDELPQLLNVVKGNMSMVGPRPEVAEYVAHYSPAQRFTLSIRPGLTGRSALAFLEEERILAQCSDTEATYLGEIMPQKLRLELEYCREFSLREDLKLLVTTALRILQRVSGRILE